MNVNTSNDMLIGWYCHLLCYSLCLHSTGLALVKTRSTAVSIAQNVQCWVYYESIISHDPYDIGALATELQFVV
jgi:hypothetical protein